MFWKINYLGSLTFYVEAATIDAAATVADEILGSSQFKITEANIGYRASAS